MAESSIFFGLIIHGFFVLILSSILFVLLRRVPSSGQRIIIPLALGGTGIFCVALNNPYLYILAYWAIPACLINTAVSILEHTGAPVFNIHAIAAGSLIIYLFSAYLGLKVMSLFALMDASLVSKNTVFLQFFLLAIFSLFFSCLLFYCIAYRPVFCRCLPLQDRPDSTAGTPVTERTTNSIPGKKWRVIFMLGLLLAITVSLFLLFVGNVLSGACSGYECGTLIVMNLGDTEPAEGTIIHLADEKIREYPPLGDALKTGETKLSSCTMELRMNDAGFFNATTFLEYRGTFYNARVIHYAGYECRRGISFTAVEQ